MVSMTDEEYTSIFLELLRYSSYLNEEKDIFQRFISGFSVGFKYIVKSHEPITLEESIINLKQSYEQLKHNK